MHILTSCVSEHEDILFLKVNIDKGKTRLILTSTESQYLHIYIGNILFLCHFNFQLR